jgi:hypothetical protein
LLVRRALEKILGDEERSPVALCFTAFVRVRGLGSERRCGPDSGAVTEASI